MKQVKMSARHSFRLSGIEIAQIASFVAICSMPVYSQLPETTLAITNAIVQRAEDGAPVPASYKFLPGEFVYFTFQIAGFGKTSSTPTVASKIDLSYSISPFDSAGVALAPAAEEKVSTELNTEDKDWTPKRRASFALPSFVAAGAYHVHVSVKDAIGNVEASGDYPFQIGGPVVLPSEAASVQSFQFFRHDNDREPLDVPAYQAGDSIFARFRITGFKKGEENRYRLSYRVTVSRPDGKPFLRDTPDVDLDSKSFYPAPYVPAEIDLTTSKDSSKGQYRLTIVVRDSIANTSTDFRAGFSIE